MKFRIAVGFCALVVGLSGLTLCQPPTPRIAKVPIPTLLTVKTTEAKDILIAQDVLSALSR